nr:hypothetical protein [Tanacetum cinerariifolium]
DLKLLDDANVLLRTPMQHNMYSIDLNNIVPHKDLTCIVAKAPTDEGMLWHRRLGHLNFKTMNRLVMHNLVRGLPSKCFENDHTCSACLKGKQHKASCKSRLVSSATKPLHTLHMDLFGPTSDETSGILRKFITEIENLKDLKVKIIRCDNGGEFRNKEMDEFCSKKGIKIEFSNAMTPQQNGVAERRNRTLIEAAKTTLADAKLPVTFWAEAVNTACTKVDARQDVKKDVSLLRYIVLPNWVHEEHLESPSSQPQDACNTDAPESSGNSNPTATSTNPPADQLETLTVETPIPNVSSPVPTVCFTDSQEPSSETRLISKRVANQVETPSLDNILTLTNRFEDILGVTSNSEESSGVEADVSNMETTITAIPTPTLRDQRDHPKSQIIGPVDTPIQTRNKSKEVGEQSFIATIHQKIDSALLQFCLFSCFLSQVEPKKISDALQDPSWDPEYPVRVYKVDKAMYGLHQAPRAWYGTLSKYLLTNGFQREHKKIFDTLQDPSWVEAMHEELLQFKIQNVWTLVDCPKGEEGINYDEVFAPVTRIEAIRLFLAYASFMGFTVYQMDVKSAFLYGTIDDEVEFKALMHEKFQMSALGELNFFLGLQILQKEDGIFLSQEKYVGDILKKFGYSDVRSANTPMDKENPWGKDGTGKDADLHLYRSMIGSLMYLTASRQDIMFAVCACARH